MKGDAVSTAAKPSADERGVDDAVVRLVEVRRSRNAGQVAATFETSPQRRDEAEEEEQRRPLPDHARADVEPRQPRRQPT